MIDITTSNTTPAFSGTGVANLDFFSKAAAMRGQPGVVDLFVKAFNENEMFAIANILYLRDIRGGLGERNSFYQILQYLEVNDIDMCKRVIKKIPMLGRWKDIFELKTLDARLYAYAMVKGALANQDGLCAKWMPRQGVFANELRAFMQLTPKQWRKTLVNLTNVVESKMCAKEWDSIDYKAVPSQAARIYASAFSRHAEAEYKEFLENVKSGKTTINAGAINACDVIKYFWDHGKNRDAIIQANADALWNALPKPVKAPNAIVMVDSSSSMNHGSAKVAPMTAAFAVGMYVAQHAEGAFKDKLLTFNTTSKIYNLDSNASVHDRLTVMKEAAWGGSTNYESAFSELVIYCQRNGITELPKQLIVVSDMQFNQSSRSADGALATARTIVRQAGFEMPQIVYWNVNSSACTHAEANENGVALINGFSTNALNSVIGLDEWKDVSPIDVMLETLSNDRYKF